MKKNFFNVALALSIASSLFISGCTENKDKTPETQTAVETQTEQVKEEVKTEANETEAVEEEKEVVKEVVKPVAKSSLYKYALHLDDEAKLPPMTDEVIKKFEECAKKVKIAPEDMSKDCHGIWIFNSPPQSRDSSGQIWMYNFVAEMPGHHATSFENSKGKKTNEQHYAHIEMTADKKTDKLRSVRVYTYELTKEMDTKGNTTEVFRESFK
ncbi:hypothetical protein IJT10_02720 [bacterium]|nr:hypothetical protein [bacterium]